MKTLHRPFALIPTGLGILIAVAATCANGQGNSETASTHASDVREAAPRTLNDYFPFRQVEDLEAWRVRSEQLRRRVQVAMGLWPEPTRTPLNAVVHGKVDRPDYTVERVYLESFPGHFVTGNLYRPKGFSGKRPAILSPHGHNGSENDLRNSGRAYDHGPEGILEKIADGWERFESGGRTPLQARGVQLARMGCVVFQYDMVGYSDSLQLTHKRLGPRDHMNTQQDWGLSSPKAELHLQSLMMLQTWNSIRSLDFLLSLPDIDTQKVGVEGHSGGGTQTFILAALDERPDVLFPAVMVGTAMQGGCICENAPYLRIGAGNVDIAALAAPRPMGLTGADDWTLEIREKGLPDLKKLYALYGVPEHVDAKVFPQFGHNFNSVSRSVMYDWFNRFLVLGVDEPITESDYRPLSNEERSVWNDSHPAPSGKAVGDAHERALLAWITSDSTQQLERLWPDRRRRTLPEFQEIVGGAFDVIVGRRLEDVTGIRSTELRTGSPSPDSPAAGTYFTTIRELSNSRSERVRLAIATPNNGSDQIVVWIHEKGIRGIFDGLDVSVQAAEFLQSGLELVGLDLIGQEWNGNRLVVSGQGSNYWNHHAAYTYGYNPPLFSQRVHDVLTVIQHMRRERPRARISLLGIGPVAAPIAAVARIQSGEAVYQLAVDTQSFRFGAIDDFAHPMFVPGAAKYLDLPGIMALAVAAGDSWIVGERRNVLDRLQSVRTAAGKRFRLTSGRRGSLESARKWLAAAPR